MLSANEFTERSIERNGDAARGRPRLKLLRGGRTNAGLPIALPLLDLEDMTAVTFADVWGGFDEPVQRASTRYRADATLIVGVRPGAFGNEVQCLLLKDGGRNTLAGVSLQQCLDGVADLYATEYSVIGASGCCPAHGVGRGNARGLRPRRELLWKR